MTSINMDKVADYINEVAQEKIVPRFRSLGEDEIHEKTSPSDLVTIADIEAEIELTRIFQDYLPGSLVVGEEAASKDEVSMSILGSESGYIWVIDPVDGTNNFASGNEKFGTMVALVKNNETIASWILDIPQNRLAMAERGSGTFINGAKRVYADPDRPLKELRGFVSRKFMPPKIRPEVEAVLDESFGDVETYMCCAHEYMEILEGESFFSVYSRIRPWDHLPGTMMVSEAGGVVRKWDGSSYGPGDERGGVIVSPSQSMWDDVLCILLKPFV